MKIQAPIIRKILIYILLQTAVVSSLTFAAILVCILQYSLSLLIGIIILLAAVTVLTIYKIVRTANEGIAASFSHLNQFSEYIRKVADTLWQNAISLDTQAALIREYGDRQTELANELGSIIKDVPPGPLTDETYAAPRHHAAYTQEEEAQR